VNTTTIQTPLLESVRSIRNCWETLTVSESSEKRSCKCHVLPSRRIYASPIHNEPNVVLIISSCFWRFEPTELSDSCRCSLASDWMAVPLCYTTVCQSKW
jgi:hypothetical protein